MRVGKIRKVVPRQADPAPREAEPAAAEQAAPSRAMVALTPAAGLPDTVSSTCVDSRPSVLGLPGPSTASTSRSRVM